MAIEITKIINKHMVGRPVDSMPLCVSWLYDVIGKQRKPEAKLEGAWCGRGWVVYERDTRYILECIEPQSEQRFALIWL
jgi:hypothetical protein